ncbi:hypothetical protein DRW03_16970 [Corallococcus sp. H22C18031201]|uniref:hypothetical protein n=1 Tax=Citreicoccus inhibens TaxID=2849499 RepID=UPI000E720F97|nr:hypothetical protein [Citreicoccus inhibens]MBU8897332.1 hypothetical protein [Citreicoccus inhibens]RJS21110.1 hypothetical protein DRW03_16970 [Corallococcus sp. H22C18031201]
MVIQPAEDFHGRQTGPRHEEPEDAPMTAGPQAPGRTEADEEDVLPAFDAQEDLSRPVDPAARNPGALLDDIPDGDGPRSDAGTNPLPEVYWSAYPDTSR